MPQRRSILTPQFTFDEASGRYRNVGSGRFVPRTTVRSALDDYIDAKAAEIKLLAEQLRRREIAISTWQKAMEENIAKIHLANAAAAKGGWSRMEKADFGRVGGLVRYEYQQLRNFAKQIENGLPLDGHFLQRAIQYAEAGRHSYHVVETREMLSRDFDEQRFVLHARDSCEDCLRLAALGWHPTGSTPEPGERECRRKCRCGKEYRKSAGQSFDSDKANPFANEAAQSSDLGDLTDAAKTKLSEVSRGRISKPPRRIDQLRPRGSRTTKAIRLTLPPANEPFLDLNKARESGERFMRGLRVVDAVVRSGNKPFPRLPLVPIRENEIDKLGGLQYQKRFYNQTPRLFYPTSVRYYPDGAHPELTAAHEMGHLFDVHFRSGRRLSTDGDLRPLLQEWRLSVESSQGYKELLRVAAEGMERELPDGRLQRVRATPDEVKYYLSSQELFARSFAQYVAVRSGDPVLLQQIKSIVQSRGLWASRQWADEADFETIAAALDKILKREGFLR